jgi:hypothetical protein
MAQGWVVAGGGAAAVGRPAERPDGRLAYNSAALTAAHAGGCRRMAHYRDHRAPAARELQLIREGGDMTGCERCWNARAFARCHPRFPP